MRRMIHIKGFHLMADGRVLPQEQYSAGHYVVVAEDNYELLKRSNVELDPNYLQKEALRRKYRKANERKEELQKQQAEIQAQLAELVH